LPVSFVFREVNLCRVPYAQRFGDVIKLAWRFAGMSGRGHKNTSPEAIKLPKNSDGHEYMGQSALLVREFCLGAVCKIRRPEKSASRLKVLRP
jgi:hypothetical protein